MKTIAQLLNEADIVQFYCVKCLIQMYQAKRCVADGIQCASTNGWWTGVVKWNLKSRFADEFQCDCGAKYQLGPTHQPELI